MPLGFEWLPYSRVAQASGRRWTIPGTEQGTKNARGKYRRADKNHSAHAVHKRHLAAVSAALPPAEHEAVTSSLGAALQISQHLHDSGLASTAQTAFMSGYFGALWTASGVAVAGALAVKLLLRKRDHVVSVTTRESALDDSAAVQVAGVR